MSYSFLFAVVMLMLLISTYSKVRAGADTDPFIYLAFLDCLLVPFGGIVALFAIARKPRNWLGLLGVGWYSLVVGLTLLSFGIVWAGSDNSFLFLLAVGASLLLIGALLILVGGAGLINQVTSGLHRTVPLSPTVGRTLFLASAGAAFTVIWFVARGPGDWAAVGYGQETRLFSFPLIIAGWAIAVAIFRITQRWNRLMGMTA